MPSSFTWWISAPGTSIEEGPLESCGPLGSLPVPQPQGDLGRVDPLWGEDNG